MATEGALSITEADEREHGFSNDWLWRESFYLNFHDASGRVGGMATVGVRPVSIWTGNRLRHH